MAIKTEVVMVFDPVKDAYVPITKAVLKTDLEVPRQVTIVSTDLDPKDPQSPIMQVLLDQEHEWDPRKKCIEAARGACRKYDIATRLGERWIRETPYQDRKRILNPPDMVYVRAQPRFCGQCMLEEHRRRKRANRWYRRLAAWLNDLKK